ncbi:MAG: aminoacyl-histidine dipeptidase [Thermoanaerobaculaceae bacterium]|nr:aminoacyl-histidine dipeptidase [Thermoanaerobaculaceae bacterium]NLH10016.1 aminoacyl-histidine dipeptidase [Holophagae bacterium]HPW55943.1 aminoacyl-histidine dipeptidase [Thermoanaerobaculaceae bacterium]
MSSPLDSLQPSLVWRHFDAICQIPHPSKHEAQLAEHIVAWAADRGLEVRRDTAGNVVVAVPATPGHESAPVVVLQGHLDMVPEANSDTPFDFTVEPIQPRVVGEYVYATGTTLGADNGIGVATAMAIAEDAEAVHGPLELLFTIDEETGLTGAMQLDPKLVTGRTLINLDTEEDGALYIGCAGGADTKSTFTITREDAIPGTLVLHLSVRGLRGGHSGVDIHENRGNALKFLVRLLLAVRRAGLEFGIVSLSGGSKHNAIPRESDAVLRVKSEDEVRIRQVVEEKAAILRAEFGDIDPGQRIEVEAVSADASTASVWLPFDAERILDALLACPHGVLGMSRAVAGLVETSSNLAVLKTEDSSVWVQTSSRSSVMPSLKATLDQVAAVFRLAGAEVETHDGYPGWKPNPASPVLGAARKAFVNLFGHEPHIKAIHAGLECGLIGEKLPGIDMVSMGPQIESPHSPDERVQIPSVDRFYTLLKATLRDLA